MFLKINANTEMTHRDRDLEKLKQEHRKKDTLSQSYIIKYSDTDPHQDTRPNIHSLNTLLVSLGVSIIKMNLTESGV